MNRHPAAIADAAFLPRAGPPIPMADPVLEAEALRVRFPVGGGVRGGRFVDALAGVDLRVGPGEFVGIVGRSGAGKSTLLRCMNRLIHPTGGRIRLLGEDITHASGGRLRGVRRRCGMVFQQFGLVPRLTVIQNVLVARLREAGPVGGALALMARRFGRAETELALDCLHQVGIADQAYKRADRLSGGQQQRVAIARVLAQDPDVILADEPVASLDPRSAARVMDALASINRSRGIPVLVNLHQVDIARSYATRVLGMQAGRLAFDGPPHELTDGALVEIYGSAAAADEAGNAGVGSLTAAAASPTREQAGHDSPLQRSVAAPAV